MKILLTGCSGFLGNHLLKKLLEEGHQIMAPVRSQSIGRIDEDHSNLQVIEGNFFDDSLFIKYQEFKPQVVIHLASIRGEGHGDWNAYLKVNVEGTRKMAQYAREQGVQLFLYCSTVGVYGTIPAHLPAGLTTSLSPDNHYHRSKYEAEKQVIELLKDQVPYVIIRPTITYGKGDDGFPAKLISMVKKKRFPLVRKTVKIHLLNVQTFTNFITLLLSNQFKSESVLILADREPVMLSELVNTIYSHFYSKSYPTMMKAPALIYGAGRMFCRLFNLKSLHTSLQLISESWYYDVNATSLRYPDTLRDTLTSMEIYLKKEFPIDI